MFVLCGARFVAAASAKRKPKIFHTRMHKNYILFLLMKSVVKEQNKKKKCAMKFDLMKKQILRTSGVE